MWIFIALRILLRHIRTEFKTVRADDSLVAVNEAASQQYSTPPVLTKAPNKGFSIEMLILFSVYTMLYQKMPLPTRFASAVSLGHCHYDTAELVFIHERGRNTSAEGSPSPLYLTAWINFASSLHLSYRIACLWANIQAKLGWSPRERALAHEVFLCSAVFDATS